ncbi:DUF72 domain-containing protein [Pararhizobium sp.]|uniref:DUF72 domain-containing protein n=1 Tax=Pararhizobium sp. TaxID=1977563 RepID=UPI003D0C17D2
MPIIATAAWSIPKAVASRFPQEGSGLARYAAVFNGVEINSTFYRRHRATTFERWASAVPDNFRFAVKLPGEITHTRRLKNVGGAFRVFLGDISPLDGKLGPLLCQLPPSLTFDERDAETAFETMRTAHQGPIVLEARHKSWADDRAFAVLKRFSISRVLADPAPVWQVADFPLPIEYVRLHGTPKLYYSSYSDEELRSFRGVLGPGSWCVFDNTTSGAAAQNALRMLDICASPAT